MSTPYAGLFRALAPEAALVFTALLVIGFDLVIGRNRDLGRRLNLATIIGAVGVLDAIACMLWVGPVGSVFGGALMLDPFAIAVRIAVLVLVLLTLGVTTGAPLTRQPAEYVALILFAAVGFLQMAAAQQLLLAFLALELASLSLYVLTGYDKTRPESAEAALKYFLVGGISAAFLLFGFSLLYGLTGSIQFDEIARVLVFHSMDPMLAVALVMVLVAFGFKAAAAPFHLWAPDAYQGAPTPSAALIASASKLAGFALFWRLLWSGLGPAAGGFSMIQDFPGWMTIVAVLSGASLLLGNLAALAQSNVRRLLAYSAIAHAGALLLGILSAGVVGPGPLFYYAATYGVAAAGAFGVVAVIERHGACQTLGDLAGLHRRSPLLAACLLVFVLSLAGIPPLAGFFGKFAVFAAALQLGGVASPVGWLALLAIAMSAVALYYYLIILKQALVAAPQQHAGRIGVPIPARLALIVAAALIVLLGIFPFLLLGIF
ncbi:MAG: NADH-quinone oxidoreductase subunit N [Opitutaceae bacterium]|nr:NADH-quinone oxidoreductase subunit N [Opitutaceae bacterium]